jgi:hypothetical protein
MERTIEVEVSGNARLFDNAQVYSDARLFDNAQVQGDALYPYLRLMLVLTEAS